MKEFWMWTYRRVYALSVWIVTKKIAPPTFIVAVRSGQQYDPQIQWEIMNGKIIGFIMEQEKIP